MKQIFRVKQPVQAVLAKLSSSWNKNETLRFAVKMAALTLVALVYATVTSCKPEDEVLIVIENQDICALNPDIEKCQPIINNCNNSKIISTWIELLPINNSGSDKVTLRHTEALRTMARTGGITALRDELCKHSPTSVNILKRGHKSDINNIGFAPQLLVEHYIIAMYHPNHYPDHFIVYDTLTKEWTRWEEGKNSEAGFPTVYLTGTGD